MTQEEHWQTMFDAYMKFMKDNKRCPSKYKAEERKLVNWLKYNRKMRNKGCWTRRGWRNSPSSSNCRRNTAV